MKIRSRYYRTIRILLGVSLSLACSCSHTHKSADDLIDYVMDRQLAARQHLTGRRTEYSVDTLNGASWLKTKLFDVGIPGLVHGDRYIVGLDKEGRFFDVYEPFTLKEPDFTTIVDTKALVDINSVSEFIALMERVYAANAVEFKILRTSDDVSVLFGRKTVPLSIEEKLGGWEIELTAVVEGFGGSKRSLVHTKIHIDRNNDTIAIESKPL